MAERDVLAALVEQFRYMLAEDLLVCIRLNAHRAPRGVYGDEDGRCTSLVISGGGKQSQTPAWVRQLSGVSGRRMG